MERARLPLTVGPRYQRRWPSRAAWCAGAHGVEFVSAVDPSPEEGKAEMVRSAAERAFLPTRDLVEEIGDMMILTGRTIWSALRPPYPYGGEFISQFLFALRLCWFPMLVSIVMLAYGPAGLQAAGFLKLIGALDRLGGFFVLAAIREIGSAHHRGRARGRRGHRDHRGPGRAQDPRGARRAAGAGRRPGQEPGRAALPGADDRDRPVQHLRDAVRDLRRHRRRASPRVSRWGRSGRRCSPT